MTLAPAPALGGIGHNNPPPEIAGDVEKLETAARKVPAVLDAETVKQAKGLVETEVSLRKRLDAERTERVRPYLDAQREINGTYQGLIERGKTAIAEVKRRIEAYIKAEEEERRRVAEMAAREAEEAEQRAVDAADPFDVFDEAREAQRAAVIARDAQDVADTKVRIRGGSGRALSTRTVYEVIVTDPRALVHHFADHPDVIAAATAVAKARARADKGAVEIPGTRINVRQTL